LHSGVSIGSAESVCRPSMLGIEKIQCSSKLLMRSQLYARSEVVALRNRNGNTDNVRGFVQSEWDILNTCTALLFDALFSLPSSDSTASGPSFVFDDIENIPIVRHRKSVVDASRYLLVDANHLLARAIQQSSSLSRLIRVAKWAALAGCRYIQLLQLPRHQSVFL
jgi:hypothetical protein